MKLYFPFLLFVLTIPSFTIFAQEKLVVEYESKKEMDLAFLEEQITNHGGVSNKEVMDAFKQELSKPNYYILELTSDESEFNFVETINNEQPTEGRVRIELANLGTIYKNLKQSIIAETVKYPKEFIIQDSIQKYDWKITKETKEILGYETRKAEAIVDSTTNLIAWYAPKLVYKNGPAQFGGLPGLILQIEEIVDSEDQKEKQIYTAISLKVDKSKKVIQFPKKGKVISRKEHEKIMEEEMKKMQEMYGEGVDKD